MDRAEPAERLDQSPGDDRWTACHRATYQRRNQRQRDVALRFKKLADKGARAQRLLWASTGTKNPDYSDVKYIESLIGPDTVNTVPVETLDGYRDHGDPKARLQQDVERAGWGLERLSELGISIDQVTQQLEDEGVEKFNKPFDKLIETLKERP
ncbi:MAG: transaldolase family protein [Pirellulaceae bacterium]